MGPDFKHTDEFVGGFYPTDDQSTDLLIDCLRVYGEYHLWLITGYAEAQEQMVRSIKIPSMDFVYSELIRKIQYLDFILDINLDMVKLSLYYMNESRFDELIDFVTSYRDAEP